MVCGHPAASIGLFWYVSRSLFFISRSLLLAWVCIASFNQHSQKYSVILYRNVLGRWHFRISTTIHTHTHTHTHLYIYIYIYIYMHVCMCVYVWMCVCVRARVFVQEFMEEMDTNHDKRISLEELWAARILKSTHHSACISQCTRALTFQNIWKAVQSASENQMHHGTNSQKYSLEWLYTRNSCTHVLNTLVALAFENMWITQKKVTIKNGFEHYPTLILKTIFHSDFAW